MEEQPKDIVIESVIAEFHEYFTDTSDERLLLGITHDIGSLVQGTEESHQEALKEGKQLLTRLQKFPTSHLPFDQKLDLELATLRVESFLFEGSHTINGRPSYKATPDAGEIAHTLFALLMNDPRPSEERFNDITGRLRDVPKYLAESLKLLDTPVKRWVEIEIEAISKLPDFFNAIKTEAEIDDYKRFSKLEKAADKAQEAFTDYVAQLKKMRTTPHFAMGVEQAQEQVRVRGIDLSLDQMQSMAKHFLQETTEQIEDLRGKLVAKYSKPPKTTVDELHHFLNQKYAVPLEKIIDTYKEEQGKVLDFIGKHNLFTIPGEQEMSIIKTPTFFEPIIPTGAIDVPFPFRYGTKKSIIYLTLGEDLVDEHTKVKIPVMMIHEGIPGHHLQFISAYKNPSTVRKHWTEAMDMAEGWTTMLEDYMLDTGYMEERELTDEARFCGKMELRRLGARVAIDLYFMTEEKDYLDVGVKTDFSSNNPFINAGKLLQEVTGFTVKRVKRELNWYSQVPGYPLSYLVGNKLVWQLKEDFAVAQKGKLKGLDVDRKFHELYLNAGCMPLNYLRCLFEHQGYLPKNE